MQSAAEALVDFQDCAGRRVVDHRVYGEVQYELRASSDGILSSRLNTSSVGGGLFCGRACATNFVAVEGGRNVGVSTSLSDVICVVVISCVTLFLAIQLHPVWS